MDAVRVAGQEKAIVTIAVQLGAGAPFQLVITTSVEVGTGT